MKKGKNALIIFIFLVLALLIFLVLVPGAIKENEEMENEVNNEENVNLEVNEEENTSNQVEENTTSEEGEVNTEFSEVDLEELREEEVRSQIDTYSPVKEEGIDGFTVTSISWTGDNVAEVEYEGNEKHKAEVEFAQDAPNIILVTQMVNEQPEVVGEDIE